MNISLITFLALKNTPLAFLTAYSYERLNILHQLAGYGTIIWSCLHGIVYLQDYHQTNKLANMKEMTNAVGAVAGVAMLIILATVLLLRKLRYEVFYVVHIVMYMLILITVGMHRPLLAKKSLIIVIFSGCIWALDRFLRFSKIIFNFFGNKASIYPLPNGGTRIVLSRTPPRATAGTHAFLWIPAVRSVETHPFTIVSVNPVEFVISAYDGFTSDLHARAVANPGSMLTCSIDGPYGTLPTFNSYQKVVLIAGGSGASFTAGMAVSLVQSVSSTVGGPSIDFIWAVRDIANISWFSKELEILQKCPNVNLILHTTRAGTVTTTSSSASSTIGADREKTSPDAAATALSADPEKSDLSASAYGDIPSGLVLNPGRPNVSELIRNAIQAAGKDERIIVSACGPHDLMNITRKTVAKEIGSCGKSVELHCEEFGW
jgi:predicted ferric reductase